MNKLFVVKIDQENIKNNFKFLEKSLVISETTLHKFIENIYQYFKVNRHMRVHTGDKPPKKQNTNNAARNNGTYETVCLSFETGFKTINNNGS